MVGFGEEMGLDLGRTQDGIWGGRPDGILGEKRMKFEEDTRLDMGRET